MRKFLGILAVVAIAASPAWATYSGQVSVGSTYGLYQTGSGGEFTLNYVSGWVGLTGLASDLGPSQFQTFCVETSEYVHTNATYDVNISTKTVQTGKDLKDKVAYLYQNFRYGTLGTLYDYDDSSGQRKQDAGLLQQAIWEFMGLGNYADNKFHNLANANVGTGANYVWQTGDLGNVRILNMFNGNLQDQLTIVPAPGAALLVVLGLGLVGWVKKRLA